jgi:hypothetical protein
VEKACCAPLEQAAAAFVGLGVLLNASEDVSSACLQPETCMVCNHQQQMQFPLAHSINITPFASGSLAGADAGTRHDCVAIDPRERLERPGQCHAPPWDAAASGRTVSTRRWSHAPGPGDRCDEPDHCDGPRRRLHVSQSVSQLFNNMFNICIIAGSPCLHAQNMYCSTYCAVLNEVQAGVSWAAVCNWHMDAGHPLSHIDPITPLQDHCGSHSAGTAATSALWHDAGCTARQRRLAYPRLRAACAVATVAAGITSWHADAGAPCDIPCCHFHCRS